MYLCASSEDEDDGGRVRAGVGRPSAWRDDYVERGQDVTSSPTDFRFAEHAGYDLRES